MAKFIYDLKSGDKVLRGEHTLTYHNMRGLTAVLTNVSVSGEVVELPHTTEVSQIGVGIYSII